MFGIRQEEVRDRLIVQRSENNEAGPTTNRVTQVGVRGCILNELAVLLLMNDNYGIYELFERRLTHSASSSIASSSAFS